MSTGTITGTVGFYKVKSGVDEVFNKGTVTHNFTATAVCPVWKITGRSGSCMEPPSKA